MDWYQNLYLGETVKKQKKELIRKVEEQKLLPGLLLIVTAPDERNQLEILAPVFFYRQQKRPGRHRIVGIARGKDEANELVRQMTEDVYRRTGSTALRHYFLRDNEIKNEQAGSCTGTEI